MKAKYAASIFAAALLFTGCTDKKDSIEYTVMNLSEYPYASFVKNWDDTAQPLLLALIKTPGEYADYFGTAATMDTVKPYTPSDREFAQYQYVLVSKVTGPAAAGRTFKVTSVVYKDSHLAVYYSFKKPDSGAGYTVKDGIVLRIPRVPVSGVTVYENGSKAAEITD